MSNTIKSFKYLGHTFTPSGNFKGSQRRFAMSHLSSIGINAYDGGSYNWEKFIAACKKANGKAFDLYEMENGKIVVPCENELFEYKK